MSENAKPDRPRSSGNEARRELLRERAREMARSAQADETTGDHLEVVEFLLAHERYGVESRYVREVYPLKELTPLPGTPPFVLGIVNVRGQILSIVDLKKFFDLPHKGLADLDRIIILHDEHMEFGILADSLLGVRRIPAEGIRSSFPTLEGIRGEFLLGVTPDRTIVLDGAKLLYHEDIVVKEKEGS